MLYVRASACLRKKLRNDFRSFIFLQKGGQHMALIDISHLTFGFDAEAIFDDVSVQLDTDWRLGLIGRNGRGKTTFLRLLQGAYPCVGTITANTAFDYFPFDVEDTAQDTLSVVRAAIAPFDRWEARMAFLAARGDEAAMQEYGEVYERYQSADGYTIDEQIAREAGLLDVPEEVLARPFFTLSHGERTKLLLAALFLKKNNFLLIDEPTNHLDLHGRRVIGEYLARKSGFILVSHDRALLDSAVDHILSINRCDIEVQRGNYTSWKENRDRHDAFERAENEKLMQDIARLQASAGRAGAWSDALERSKIGAHAADRGFIGHKSAKMMKRAKTIERRCEEKIEQKRELFKNIEQADSLKLHLLKPPRKRLVEVERLAVDYGARVLFSGLSFTVEAGERVALTGPNGSGKSSVLGLLLGRDVPHTGAARVAPGTVISHIPQDTSFLRGSLDDFIAARSLDGSLLRAILRKLDFTRAQFSRDLADYSGGQKKKVLLAAALSRPAHLLVWDEPLNFIDILSREQIEALLLREGPTMLFVEHDAMFIKNVATKTVAVGEMK